EDGRLDEIPFLADALAAGQHLGAALAARVDVAHDAVELLLADLRALRGGGVEGIADFGLLHFLEHAIDKLIVHLLLDKQARAGAAALALVEEEGEVRALDGGIQIGIGEDDVGTLAAQLERDALEG